MNRNADHIQPGQVYRLPVWSDWWMRGETTARVESVGRKLVHFRGIRSGKAIRASIVTVVDHMERTA